MKVTKTPGMLLLAVYLIMIGLVGLAHINLGVVPPVVAVVAGIFILIGR